MTWWFRFSHVRRCFSLTLAIYVLRYRIESFMYSIFVVVAETCHVFCIGFENPSKIHISAEADSRSVQARA